MTQGMDEDRSVLHFLTRIGVMDDGHVAGGMTYLDWQHSYSKASGAKTMRMDDRSSGSEAEEKAAKYAKLLLLIRRKDEKHIAEALYIRPVPQEVRTILYDMRQVYIDSFNTLGNIIREVNKLFPCARPDKDI